MRQPHKALYFLGGPNHGERIAGATIRADAPGVTVPAKIRNEYGTLEHGYWLYERHGDLLLSVGPDHEPA